MSGKYALIIGNTEYTDPGLAQLTAPGKDAVDFARILKDQEIGAFDQVNILLNQLSSMVIEAIDEFFDQKKPDDLLVLYFSGHGVRDEFGALYLAVKNTNRARLRSTAVKSDYIRESMDQSRSKRQVLILDCCNSGAFVQGTKAAIGVSIGTASAFEAGYGRIILTASDSTQFAWEGDKVIGETDNSLFTHFLVEGLKGEADLDGDGRITVDELYEYAYERVRYATPKQTPSKFSSRQQGEIVLRQSMRIEDMKPMSLPGELINEIEDTRPYVREAAVQKLEKILKGRNIGLARSAREALEKIAIDDDTTRRVSQMATQLLESIRQQEQKAEDERKAKQEAERLLAEQKAEEERIANAKLEAERLAAEKAVANQKAREEAERSTIKKAEEVLLAREKAEAGRKALEETERLARAQVEREAAKLETARLTAERRPEEESQRSLSREKLGEKRTVKAKSNAVAPKLSKMPESRSPDTRTYSRTTRVQAKETPTGALVSSARPQPFIRHWPWIVVVLFATAAFALLATVGGYLWRKTSSNVPHQTPPLLIAVSGSDSTNIPFPDNTAISNPINTAYPTLTPYRTNTSSPEPTNLLKPVIPYFTTNIDTYCYDGPATSSEHHWELYIDQTAEVFAKWSGNSDWLLVDINEPAKTRTDCCWVNSSKGTLNVSLDQIKTTSIVPDRMDCSAVK